MDPAGLRIGHGHDLHRLVAGRPLVLGGLTVPFELGPDAHSDGDVLLHAVTDALLGAAGRGDIGEWFPDTDERWRGADSGTLLQAVAGDLKQAGWRIINLDCTISAERPKLGSFKRQIAARVAELLEVEDSQVNVKAKSSERVGPVGRGEAIAACATVLLYHDRPGSGNADSRMTDEAGAG